MLTEQGKENRQSNEKKGKSHLWKILPENMNSYGRYKQIICIQ